MVSKVVGAIIVVVVVVVAALAYVLISDSGEETDYESGSETIGHDVETLTETDCNLWIVGNANLDDVLDEQDIEYIQAIIDGEAVEYYLEVTSWSGREAVSMADANGDGVVDEQDIEKVRSMIDGEEQIIYYIDVDGIRNSVHYPVSSIVSLYYLSSLQVQILDATDMVIACDETSEETVYLNSNFDGKSLWDDNARMDPEPESIIALNPDIIITGSREWYCNDLEASLPSNRDNMDVVRLSSWEDGNVMVGTLTLAFILGNMEKGLEYVEWYSNLTDLLADRTADISDDEKANVIVLFGNESMMLRAMCVGSGYYETSMMININNIADRLGTYQDYIYFEEEWLYEQSDLDFIIYSGYDKLNDTTHNVEWNESMVERYASLTEAYGTEIHTISSYLTFGGLSPIGAVYLAKFVYPDLFEDIDPDSIFQDFVDTFMVGWDFDVSEYNSEGGVAV